MFFLIDPQVIDRKGDMGKEHGSDANNPANTEGGEMQENISEKMNQYWENVVRNSELLEAVEHLYAAGGGVAQLLGLESSKIWKAIEAEAVNGVVTFEKVEKSFSLDVLRLMGEFYRLQQYAPLCIDERLAESGLNDHGIHCHCGMCGVIEGLIGKIDGASVEDHAAVEKGIKRDQKDPLVEGMEEDHESLSMFISCDQSRSLSLDERSTARAVGALPFNISLPVDAIAEFLKTKGIDLQSGKATEFLNALVDWNAGVARAIIGGGHNIYQDQANETLIIMDTRGVQHTGLLNTIEEILGQRVQYGSIKKIS